MSLPVLSQNPSGGIETGAAYMPLQAAQGNRSALIQQAQLDAGYRAEESQARSGLIAGAGRLADRLAAMGEFLFRQNEIKEIEDEARALAPFKTFAATVGQAELGKGNQNGWGFVNAAMAVGVSNPILERMNSSILESAKVTNATFIEKTMAERQFQMEKELSEMRFGQQKELYETQGEIMSNRTLDGIRERQSYDAQEAEIKANNERAQAEYEQWQAAEQERVNRANFIISSGGEVPPELASPIPQPQYRQPDSIVNDNAGGDYEEPYSNGQLDPLPESADIDAFEGLPEEEFPPIEDDLADENWTPEMGQGDMDLSTQAPSLEAPVADPPALEAEATEMSLMPKTAAQIPETNDPSGNLKSFYEQSLQKGATPVAMPLENVNVAGAALALRMPTKTISSATLTQGNSSSLSISNAPLVDKVQTIEKSVYEMSEGLNVLETDFQTSKLLKKLGGALNNRDNIKFEKIEQEGEETVYQMKARPDGNQSDEAWVNVGSPVGEDIQQAFLKVKNSLAKIGAQMDGTDGAVLGKRMSAPPKSYDDIPMNTPEEVSVIAGGKDSKGKTVTAESEWKKMIESGQFDPSEATDVILNSTDIKKVEDSEVQVLNPEKLRENVAKASGIEIEEKEEKPEVPKLPSSDKQEVVSKLSDKQLKETYDKLVSETSSKPSARGPSKKKTETTEQRELKKLLKREIELRKRSKNKANDPRQNVTRGDVTPVAETKEVDSLLQSLITE